MMDKYRVHEVAKDLGVPSKDVIDLLAKYFDSPKKHMTALTEKELDVVFEHYTQKNQVSNFEAYFQSGKKEAQEPKAAPAAEKAPAPAKSANAGAGNRSQNGGARPNNGQRGQNAAPRANQNGQNQRSEKWPECWKRSPSREQQPSPAA